jgi:hypothetical protein
VIRTPHVVFVAVASLVSSGCSQAVTSGPPCTNDLDFIAAAIGCPASFDGSEAQLPACRASDGYTQTVWSCDVIYLHTGMGTMEGDCYYDDASHALVGVRRYATMSAFCDGGSLTESAGRQPRACPQAPVIEQFCSPTP